MGSSGEAYAVEYLKSRAEVDRKKIEAEKIKVFGIALPDPEREKETPTEKAYREYLDDQKRIVYEKYYEKYKDNTGTKEAE
jgi:hypothetical protein